MCTIAHTTISSSCYAASVTTLPRFELSTGVLQATKAHKGQNIFTDKILALCALWHLRGLLGEASGNNTSYVG